MILKPSTLHHYYYLSETTMEAYLIRIGIVYLRKNYAADHLHIGYVCRLGVPNTDYLTSSDRSELLLREMRMIQNTTRDNMV